MARDQRYKDAGWLRWKYWMEGLSGKEIGSLCGVHGNTISSNMRKKRIPLRSASEVAEASWARGDHDGCFDSEETRRKMSEAASAKWARGVFDTEEKHRKQSEGMKAAHARGAFDNAKPRAPFYPYKGTDYRSTWEVRMVQTFERLGWAWEYEPCRIPYVLDDGAHTYTPDFYVPHIDTYFDPHWDRFDDSPKFAAVREQSGINLVVMDEQQLKSFEARSD